MKIALIFLMLVAGSTNAQQRGTLSGLVPSFKIEANPITLFRPTQPWSYFDKVGRKAAILGYENGSFEAWIFPLKILRKFELSFLLRNSTDPISGASLVKRIEVQPEATTLTYVHEAFTVREIFIAPRNEPGLIVLLDVHTIAPLSIVISFLPVLQPMWPAGLGGQYSYWDDGTKAYIISESSKRNTAVVGSPRGVGISYTPAHMLSDAPNQFKIDVEPGQTDSFYIPLAIAGGKMNVDEAKSNYAELIKNPRKYYEEARAHFESLRSNTLQVVTPDETLNLAFEWSKIAFDDLVVTNPDLGTGLVAGFGPSGTSGRPGFGWYFGGDAFINSYALNSYQAFETVRDALAFTQKWQRADGKMAHELSQGAAYTEWVKDYPFGYIHADTTPYFIAAMGDYFQNTGDTVFVRQSWESITKAFEWCLTTDENGDGLMDNSKAGLGALEFGPLTGIQTDIYLGAIWVKALQSMEKLVRALGEIALMSRSQQLFAKARRALNEKFWDEPSQTFLYGWTKEGKKVMEVTPWPAVGMFFDLLDGTKSVKMLEKLRSSSIRSDWGVRLLSTESKLYEPLNYNYGAVWPFINGFTGVAEYSFHDVINGLEIVQVNARHHFEHGLGSASELLSGNTYTPVAEAVPHQGFSTFGFVLPFVQGLLGLRIDVPEQRILFAPHLPPSWPRLEISNFRASNNSYNFLLKRQAGRMSLHVQVLGSKPFELIFSPALPFSSVVRRIVVNGLEQPTHSLETDRDIHVPVTISMSGSVELLIEYDEGPEIFLPEKSLNLGDRSTGLRVISMTGNQKSLMITVEGLGGMRYPMKVKNKAKISSVSNGKMKDDELIVEFPSNGTIGFVRQSLSIQLK